jgi:creatinine amidohydrolase
MTIHFAELTSDEVGELSTAAHHTVLLLPVGAVEPHGPHAPLNTDGILATTHCERVAAEFVGNPDVRVLVLPPLAYGVTRYATGFPGAVSVSEETLNAFVIDVCTSLAADGFSRIAIVNHHFEPEHVAVLRTAAEVLRGNGLRCELLDLTRRRNAERLTDEFKRGSCHAGQYETSLVLACRPELVRADIATVLPELEIAMPLAIADGQTSFRAMGMDQSYCGSPAKASGVEGNQTWSVLCELLTELVRELA